MYNVKVRNFLLKYIEGFEPIRCLNIIVLPHEKKL